MSYGDAKDAEKAVQESPRGLAKPKGFDRHPRYRVVYFDPENDRILEGIGTFVAETSIEYLFSWVGDSEYHTIIDKDQIREIWTTTRPLSTPHIWGFETRIL